jgi:RHS repeat-associated protein
LLQEQSYYPFGVEMAAISDKAMNKLSSVYKFNGGDEMEESISMYSTFYRVYDQQLGRFMGVDIKGEEAKGMSVYHFSGNNPITFNDPNGDKYLDRNGNVWHHADPYADIPGMAGTPYVEGWGDDGFGGASSGGGGGGGFSAAWQEIIAQINSWDGRGFSLASMSFRENSKGDYGMRMYFENRSTDPNAPTSVTSFIKLPELNNLKDFKTETGIDIFGKILETATVSFDITKNGFIGAQQIANKVGGTNYLIKDIGDYKLFNLGRIGSVTAEVMSRAAGIITISISLRDIWTKGLNWDNGTDTYFGAVSFVPGVGWIIGGTYFFSNMMIKEITGKSIGDYLHQYVGSSLDATMFMGGKVGGVPIL